METYIHLVPNACNPGSWPIRVNYYWSFIFCFTFLHWTVGLHRWCHWELACPEALIIVGGWLLACPDLHRLYQQRKLSLMSRAARVPAGFIIRPLKASQSFTSWGQQLSTDRYPLGPWWPLMTFREHRDRPLLSPKASIITQHLGDVYTHPWAHLVNFITSRLVPANLWLTP